MVDHPVPAGWKGSMAGAEPSEMVRTGTGGHLSQYSNGINTESDLECFDGETRRRAVGLDDLIESE